MRPERKVLKDGADTYEKTALHVPACAAVPVRYRLQGQPALNEPVYLMVQGQLMEQLQVLHSGPRTCTHPSFSFEKQEAPDELLCLPLSNFYHRIVTPCVAVCTLCGQHRVAAAASRIPPAP